MKKSLLMTTALVALVSASNARAEDWTVSAPESIENQILNKDNVTIQAGGEVAISGDTESGIIAKSFTMEGGKLTATSVNGSADTGIFVKSDSSDINLNGGTIELTNSRIYKGNDTETSGDINISGGDITLNKDAYIEMRKENSGNVNITGGNLLLNENSALLINSNNDQEVEGNASKVIINGEGAQITATGNNRITGNIDFTNGTLTVSDNASLTSGDITMSGEDAQIDLSGQLNTNISGNGNISFQNSASNITGNVSDSHLTFEADHSLSQAISGGISNLASLSVDKGTLTYDKPSEGLLGNVNVAQGAGLNVNKFMQTNDLTLNGKVSINDDAAAQGNITIADASIDMNGKSLNAIKEGITMTSGTINMNNGSGDQDLTLWAAKDINISGGTINMNGREASIDTFYDLLKRYKPSNTINIKDVRELCYVASKNKAVGIFITTAKFSKTTKEEFREEQVTPIILIDGKTLIDSCIDNELGFVYKPNFNKQYMDRLMVSDAVTSENVSQTNEIEENIIQVEKKITANDIRARILSLPKVILDNLDSTKNKVAVCFNNEIQKELTINKGRNYLAGVTEIYRKYGLLTEDDSIFPAVSLWKLTNKGLKIDIKII